jgi:hypothetical protein
MSQTPAPQGAGVLLRAAAATVYSPQEQFQPVAWQCFGTVIFAGIF